MDGYGTVANNKRKAVSNFLADMRHNLTQQEGVSICVFGDTNKCMY